jgi:hypothetical protein
MPSSTASDFTTGGNNDAFWYVFLPNGVQRCSTSGMSFVGYLQQILGVDQTLMWGPSMSAALVSALQTAGADPVVIQGVQDEATFQSVGLVTLTAAIWLMHNYAAVGTVPQAVTLNQINLSSTTVPPDWGEVSTSTLDRVIGPPTCVLDSTATGGTPETQTTNVTASTGGNAPAVPSTAHDVIYQGGSSISWMLIAILAGGFGVAVWLTMDMMKQSRTQKSPRFATTRRNASSRRRRARR